MRLKWSRVGSLDNDSPVAGHGLMNPMVNQHFKPPPNAVPPTAKPVEPGGSCDRESPYGDLLPLLGLIFNTVWAQALSGGGTITIWNPRAEGVIKMDLCFTKSLYCTY